jgi:lipid-binding SYLF domain-containing protein
MRKCDRPLGALLVLAMAVVPLMRTQPVMAASGAELTRDAAAALEALYAGTPRAKELGAKARGILVFPSIIKAGFIVGGQYGEGALRKGGKTVAYYNTVAASYGLQAGAQSFGYALFFMTDSGLKYLDKSGGWEIGTGPSIVIVDQGTARALTTTTAQSDIFAFFFDQKGLMAGAGLQGSKISRINK